MTAEVVIMNAIGVAMAADSAVTVGVDARKIFASTDKLFQLSYADPIAVMTYGNAVLLGVPWETIVKQYREAEGSRRLSTVGDHAERFLRFIRQNVSMFPRRVEDEYVKMMVSNLFRHFRDSHLRKALDEAAKASGTGKIQEGEIPSIASRALKKFRTYILDDSKRLPGFGSQSVARIAQRHRPTVQQELNETFRSLPFDSSTKSALTGLALTVLSREIFGPMESGLVFAGFGAREFLPCMGCVRIEGFADRKLRVSRPDFTRIETLGTTASIIPFAQKEVVEAFMEGCDKRLRRQFIEQSELAIAQVANALAAAVEKKNRGLAGSMRQVLKSGLPRVMEALNKKWDDYSSGHWQPITEIVSTLPKDELAAMAEAIVNLTKFKRRITPQRETVGGPIDVAVITRGDGFVWIRRKHYFDPALNPRIMARFGLMGAGT